MFGGLGLCRGHQLHLFQLQIFQLALSELQGADASVVKVNVLLRVPQHEGVDPLVLPANKLVGHIRIVELRRVRAVERVRKSGGRSVG
jgi:hypothetical protein